MTDSDVTKDGVRGERAGREAVPDSLRPGGTPAERSGPAAAGERDRKRRRGKRRGEEPMVPRAEFGSYYGRPVIKAPGWEATDIAGYFFAGRLAGAAPYWPPGPSSAGAPPPRRR